MQVFVYTHTCMHLYIYIYYIYVNVLYTYMFKGSWEAILPSYEWLLLDGIDYDEGWCETLHYITIHQKRIDFDEGWCETLHYITTHNKRIRSYAVDLDEGW